MENVIRNYVELLLIYCYHDNSLAFIQMAHRDKHTDTQFLLSTEATLFRRLRRVVVAVLFRSSLWTHSSNCMMPFRGLLLPWHTHKTAAPL